MPYKNYIGLSEYCTYWYQNTFLIWKVLCFHLFHMHLSLHLATGPLWKPNLLLQTFVQNQVWNFLNLRIWFLFKHWQPSMQQKFCNVCT